MSARPLRATRILSLALNLPGPAALMRLRAMGASCTKLEPPAPTGRSGDPMQSYNPNAYATLHAGVKVIYANLKTDEGQSKLHQALVNTDILLTSFRPSALKKLGLGWRALHAAYPALAMVCIVGAGGERAEEPGHDLTYLAEAGLVDGLNLPPTLYADMGGALMASEAVLQARLEQLRTGRGLRLEVALADAAHYLALPRSWGLTKPDGAVGGAHAGYRVYACKDGRVAIAALEPRFAKALMDVVGAGGTAAAMFQPLAHQAVAQFVAGKTRRALDALAQRHDLPLLAMRRGSP
jgi:crotonobetainyl-CoA:carnitine CoA-transferase CaiB-like acyl-CoA transferase